MNKLPQTWKQYEWLVTKIFHDNTDSIEIEVFHDEKLDGKLSAVPRQIDVLVIDKSANIRTIV